MQTCRAISKPLCWNTVLKQMMCSSSVTLREICQSKHMHVVIIWLFMAPYYSPYLHLFGWLTLYDRVNRLSLKVCAKGCIFVAVPDLLYSPHRHLSHQRHTSAPSVSAHKQWSTCLACVFSLARQHINCLFLKCWFLTYKMSEVCHHASALTLRHVQGLDGGSQDIKPAIPGKDHENKSTLKDKRGVQLFQEMIHFMASPDKDQEGGKIPGVGKTS